MGTNNASKKKGGFTVEESFNQLKALKMNIFVEQEVIWILPIHRNDEYRESLAWMIRDMMDMGISKYVTVRGISGYNKIVLAESGKKEDRLLAPDGLHLSAKGKNFMLDQIISLITTDQAMINMDAKMLKESEDADLADYDDDEPKQIIIQKKMDTDEKVQSMEKRKWDISLFSQGMKKVEENNFPDKKHQNHVKNLPIHRYERKSDNFTTAGGPIREKRNNNTRQIFKIL